MNWNQIQGNWKEFTGKAQQTWGKFTEDELDQIAGKRGKTLTVRGYFK